MEAEIFNFDVIRNVFHIMKIPGKICFEKAMWMAYSFP